MAFELDQQLIADFTASETTPLQALWARVNAQAAELDPLAAEYDAAIRKLNPKHQNGFMAASSKVIWVTSLKVPARSIRSGRVTSTPPLLAAQLMVGGSHRLATPEEIQSWHDEQKVRKEQVRMIELAKNPPAAATQVVLTEGAIRAMQAPQAHEPVPQPRPERGKQQDKGTGEPQQ